MPNPMQQRLFNNSLAQRYASRNPNSLYARIFPQFANRVANTAGSNNAGMTSAVAPVPSSNQPAPSGSNNAPPYGTFMPGIGEPPSGFASVPSFEAGGMMTEQGTALRPGAAMPQNNGPQLGADAAPQLNGQQIEQEAQKFVQSNPQVVQQLQAVIAHAIQTGELTPQELNTAVQLAKTAIANPASYPQIRQFAIQNGLGTEQDIPQQMDTGLLYTLVVVGKTMQTGGGSATTAPSGALPKYEKGGMTGEKAHVAQLDPHEYVIPKDALIYHGKKTFDRMVEQARTPPDAN